MTFLSLSSRSTAPGDFSSSKSRLELNSLPILNQNLKKTATHVLDNTLFFYNWTSFRNTNKYTSWIKMSYHFGRDDFQILDVAL